MENTTSSKITDLRQSPAYGKYIESLGWKVIGNRPQIFIRKIGIFGSIAKIQRFQNLNWESIRTKLKANRVWMTKLEPDIQYSVFNIQMKQDNWPMLATKTLRIDLTPSLENIFNQFKKDCRYILRKANSKEFMVHRNKFDEFFCDMEKVSQNKKIVDSTEKRFRFSYKMF